MACALSVGHYLIPDKNIGGVEPDGYVVQILIRLSCLKIQDLGLLLFVVEEFLQHQRTKAFQLASNSLLINDLHEARRVRAQSYSLPPRRCSGTKMAATASWEGGSCGCLLWVKEQSFPYLRVSLHSAGVSTQICTS